MRFAGTGGEGGEYRRHFSSLAAETDGKPARDSCRHRSAASGASQSLSWPPQPEGGVSAPCTPVWMQVGWDEGSGVSWLLTPRAAPRLGAG